LVLRDQRLGKQQLFREMVSEDQLLCALLVKEFSTRGGLGTLWTRTGCFSVQCDLSGTDFATVSPIGLLLLVVGRLSDDLIEIEIVTH
jgi:hypothetical protein